MEEIANFTASWKMENTISGQNIKSMPETRYCFMSS